ncbi:hypothetical protein AMK01_PD00409 (plasmid) [Rhizobium sp. N6212]|nr:hypothetical protein AMK01_PD00409 [Rhizobium sp. N6212]ANL01341.1 hypothetical protein AMK00_PD00408 [Rhizobium sp. N621]ANL07464.1 hypothetical protein AMJ99_PD00410 [Rhizobium esperanzae]ANL13634.1 hypothetical protein AMJ98_PE00410 [Rhizobium sp. N1341]ANM38305.1 hypothetical protein AMK04_PD00411 [Rhizobium sp. N871]ANM44459.1 hypothetical protein AMK03_PE00411 [Rhizobium sp. N741]
MPLLGGRMAAAGRGIHKPSAAEDPRQEESIGVHIEFDHRNGWRPGNF